MADVESLELQITGDATKAKKSLDDLINTLDRLKTATSGGCGLSSVADGLQQVNNSGKNVSTSNGKSARSFVNLGAKITAAALALKKGGQVVASWIKESSEYTENLNLFTVAMGEYADSAKQYAEKVGEAMGIDPSDWMRAQGVFMTMATGFGVASDRAATLSQNLTQLGYDLSSFYNIDVTEAMTKLRSGLAGELEPLRALGYDLSKAKLEATALSLGIDKAVDSMTQAEKAELRYYAIMTQVTTVQGDMARTLEAPANQLRVLKAQATQAARALGDLFIPALNAILPVAIAVLKVITALAKIIARIFGADVQQGSISSSMGDLASNAGSASDAIDEATGSAKKLRKTLLGIDELNVMSDSSGGSGSTDVGGGFDFELPTYDFIGEMTETRVAQIVEDMKEWLGITDDIDTWSELMDTRLGSILKTVGAIGVAFTAWKLTEGFTSAMKTVEKIINNPVQSLVIGATLAITGFTIAFIGMEDAVNNGLDGFNFGEIIGGSILGTGGAALLGSTIATLVDSALSCSVVDLAFTQAGINLGVGTAGAAGAALFAGISSIILGIPMYFVGIYDAVNAGIDWLNGLLISGGATLAGAGIGTLIGSMGGPIGAGVGALIGLCVGLITDFTIWLWQNFDKVESWFMKIPKWARVVVVAIGLIVASISGLGAWIAVVIAGVVTFIKKWDEIAEGFQTNVVQPIEDTLSKAADWVDTNVIQPIIRYFTPIFDAFREIKDYAKQKFTEIKDAVKERLDIIWDKIVEIKDKLVEVFQALKWAFEEYIWDPIVEKLTTFYQEKIKPIVDDVKEAFTSIYQKFKEKVIDPIKKKIDELKEKLVDIRDEAVEIFKKIGTSVVDFISGQFKGVINGVLSKIETNINSFIRLLNAAIGLINQIPGVNITRVNLLSIPRLAEGGVVTPGQMFVANEAGPELVGNVGRKTAVVNNDQIVDSVSKGVYQAVVAAMGSSNGNQVVEAKVNDKVLFEVVVSRARQETVRTGFNPLLGGV